MMSAKRYYTQEEIVAGLSALEINGGNMKKTAREIGVPEPTLRTWYQRARALVGIEAASNDPHEHNFATMWAEVQHAATQRLMQLLPTSYNLRDVAVAAGIAADKHLDFTLGRKGATINVDNSQRTVNLGADDLLGALLRQQENLGHSGVIVDVTPVPPQE